MKFQMSLPIEPRTPPLITPKGSPMSPLKKKRLHIHIHMSVSARVWRGKQRGLTSY